MPSTLTWLDQDHSARDRSLRILALFQERESRDELGIGAVRDAISDRLFPGTSTIQTRLRYMLIIPWMYQRLERERVPAREFASRARRDEIALTAPLLATGEDGVFGRVAREGLKRLPSSVYWAGLGSWGIRRFNGAQSEYHQRVDGIFARRDRARRREDDDQDPDAAAVTWHPRLPRAPDGFPEQVDLKLTTEEAEFLVDRIRATHPDSLLGWLALQGRADPSDAPWHHQQQHDFSQPVQTLLHHGRLFADAVEGAARIYNIGLARARGDADLEARHQAALVSWRKALNLSALSAWSLDEFWMEVSTPEHRITDRTRTFVEGWVARVLERGGDVGDDRTALELVRERERWLKGAWSRFDNRGALAQWGGSSGTGRLTYRWQNTRRFLDDLLPALGRT